MMNTIILVLLGLLSGFFSVCDAATESIVATEEGGIRFRPVASRTSERSMPYRVVFNHDGLRAAYKFDTGGRVGNTRVGSERYGVSEITIPVSAA